jgi:NAD(P)-dependent dehydrogenase (short-subunit alcohol dehydrogenase family)
MMSIVQTPKQIAAPQLANKTCLIAGASGAIGLAVAKLFHHEGANLALTYFSQKPGSDWHRSGPNSGPGAGPSRVLEIPLDICNKEDLNAAVQSVVERFGTVDVLVNCAGVLGPIGPTVTVSMDAWVEAVEINLMGSFYLTRAVLPLMLERNKGKIIYFSGGGAAYARPFLTAYGASKAALVRFTESLAEEVVEAHVDVNIIAPGPVNSRMWNQMRSSAASAGPKALSEIKNMEETGGVSAQRAAELAVFLASERSNGLTGRLISAIHDDWKVFDQRIPDIMRSEAGTLRRIPLNKAG